MATVNPFDLLDVDAEDPVQIVAAKPLKVEKAAPVKPAKLPTKPLPPTQAVKEAKNGPGGGRRDGGSSGGRVGGYNREARNFDGPRNENGFGGGYRPSGEGDGARRGGSVGGYRGGDRGPRHGGASNGDSGDFQRPPRRHFDRHSGTGHGTESRRDGAGRGNWGTTQDDLPVTEESTTVAEKNEAVEKKEGSEEEAADAKKETPAKEQAEREPEPVDNSITFAEYEKALEEKKKAMEVTKVEERKVDTKAFETMQQLSSKKSNNDEVFIKLGAEKDKRVVEKEEKTKKTLNVEFLRPARYTPQRGDFRGGRGGRGGRGERDEAASGEGGRGGRGPRDGAAQGHGGRGPRDGGRGGRGPREGPPPRRAPAPAIEDTAQFPTLGKQ